MADGKIVLFASHANDVETGKKLNELGSTVSHIIALDAVHQLYLSVRLVVMMSYVSLANAIAIGLHQGIPSGQARRAKRSSVKT